MGAEPVLIAADVKHQPPLGFSPTVFDRNPISIKIKALRYFSSIFDFS
jgi:hypothetical protein